MPSAAGFRHRRFVALGRSAVAAPLTAPGDYEMDVIATLNAALSGRYHLKHEIGHGGMATVYLADDLKHQRSVALKVLHPELGVVLGAERFLTEIRTTANLQHPNILPLYDSGTADGLVFYMMPYVEGETVRERMTRDGQLSIGETVRIIQGAAAALDYAHRRGIIHRDIKPENILLQDGQALVADFGVALAVSNAASQRITQTGMSVGTPAYMSPEQAAAERQLDGRSDVYSLAAVMYEMLCGEAPFTGPTAAAIMARMMTEVPREIETRRPSVPAYISEAVRRSLEKVPGDRFATAADFSLALEKPGTGTYRATIRAARSRRRELAYAAGAVVLTAAAFLAWPRSTKPTAPGVVRFTIQPAPGTHLDFSLSGVATRISLSSDGRRVAYVAGAAGSRQLYVQSIAELRPRALAGTTGAKYPEFSPDGKWIAYESGATLQKISVDGGSPVAICSTGGSGISGITWESDRALIYGRSLLSDRGDLWRVSAEGGEPRRLSTFDSTDGEPKQAPRSVDGGQLVFFSIATSNISDMHIGVISMERRKTVVFQGLRGGMALGLTDGYLLYVSGEGALMAAPFDRRSLAVGAPIQVGDSIAVSNANAAAALSGNGSLVYVHGGLASQLVTVDEHGQSRTLVDSVRAYAHPRYSPDGKRIAFDVARDGGADIWTYNLVAHTTERVTRTGFNTRPEWTPDGKRLLFPSNHGLKYSLWSQPADGSAKADLLLQAADGILEGMIAPDGHALVYRVDTEKNNRDIYLLPLTGERKPVPLLTGPTDDKMPRISPDSKWLAYVSDESGAEEVYGRLLSGPGGRVAVSAGGGMEPVWSRDGKRLFYRNGTRMMSATIATIPALSVTARQMLFDAPFASDPYHPNFDVAPDGKSFLMIRPMYEDRQMVMVVNWAEELRKRVGGKK